MKKKLLSLGLAVALSVVGANAALAANQSYDVIVDSGNDYDYTQSVVGQGKYGRITLVADDIAGAFIWQKCQGDIGYNPTNIQVGTDPSHQLDTDNVYMSYGCSYKLEVRTYSYGADYAKGYIRNWD
ncbi:hypothetical protein J2T17_007459 [Paenibacillus mucilaginosus]|uniref:hypothetical protein n=1 Tax=Paenibacillus mucilaginosus TaxID=61624 RepID=UPI003D1A57BE